MEVNPAILKAAVGLLALCLAGFLLGPPLYWNFTESLAAVTHSSVSSSSGCPPCLCDCSSWPFSIPYGLLLNFSSDCAKHDLEASEETKSNITELREELKLQEAEALKNQQHADNALLEAKKMTSRYQKEADKCNSGMETCEGGRETAEAALAAQKKFTAMWELRARQKGWTEKVTMSHADSQKNVTNA